ncbi:MAG: hypothetical protein U0984_04030, partial [Prosthecobacter sp.]|nr:hypothetical protein [Prosthecobacter sp.]
VSDGDEWRQKEIEALAAEAPELAAAAATIKTGTWAENGAILEGASDVAPRTSSTYQKLLFWMHLDPPENAEVRAKIPALLAALRPDDTLLDLWKKLVYEGSANAEDIRAAAKQQIHHNTESKVWTEAQIKTLTDIAGWGVATAAP